MQLTPLDETEDIYLYSKEFGDSGITLMIPVLYAKTKVIQEEEGLLQLAVMGEKGTDAPFFVVTGIKGDGAVDTPLKDWKAEDLKEAFSYIFDKQEDMQLSYTEEYGAEYPALRITFPEHPDDCRHLAGLRDGWLLVLSTFAVAENTDLSVMEPYEEILAQYMLQPYDFLPQVETIELEGGMSLHLPEGMLATVDRYDEYDDAEYVLYFINAPDSSGKLLNQLLLTTIRNPEYAGKTLGELDDSMLSELAGRILMNIGELSFTWLPQAGGTNMMLLREAGYTINGYENSSAYYLMAMKDGWFLGLAFLDHGIWPREETLTFQMNCLTSLLEGKGQVPSNQPPSISWAMENGTLEASFPYGYGLIETQESEEITHYDILNLLKPDWQYYVFADESDTYTGTIVDEGRESIESYAAELEQMSGQKITIEEKKTGLLGEPALVLFADGNLFIREFCYKDERQIGIGVQSSNTPIAQEEIDAMSDLFRFVDR